MLLFIPDGTKIRLYTVTAFSEDRQPSFQFVGFLLDSEKNGPDGEPQSNVEIVYSFFLYRDLAGLLQYVVAFKTEPETAGRNWDVDVQIFCDYCFGGESRGEIVAKLKGEGLEGFISSILLPVPEIEDMHTLSGYDA